MIAGAAIELVVAALLVATCVYCFVLNRRLKALTDGQAEMQTALTTFDDATRRAEKNLQRMEQEGLGTSRDLSVIMTRANALVSELSVMVNAGDHIAGRIEGAVKDVRSIGERRITNENRQ